LAFDDLPDIAPLTVPVLAVLQEASRHFGDEPFSTRVWVANGGTTLHTDVVRPDFDPLFGDSGHMQMQLQRYAGMAEEATQPLMDALKTWCARIGAHPPLGFSLAVGVGSMEGVWGRVRPGFHPLGKMTPLDDLCHSVTQGLFGRALRVAATLGNPSAGHVWSLRDAMEPNGEPPQVLAATVEDAFALLGAYHAPELWVEPQSFRWDLAQHHSDVKRLASSLERFG
jgi:hypothetical protein